MRKRGQVGIHLALVAGLLLAGLPAAAEEHDPPVEVPAFKGAAGDTFAFVDRVTDGNLLGLNITNYGFFGNDFITRDPSMEYPLGSEVDHLIRAGLWIGGVNVNGDTLVTTGTVDGYWRTGGSSTSEYTPRTRSIKERSVLIFRPSYSKDAVSEQDLLAAYDDLGAKPRPGIEQHRPLGVHVGQKSYLWSYEFANSFVIVSFDVVNITEDMLTNVYFGLYGEMASGWKGGFERWPPSGWFRNKVLQYDAERHFLGEHRTRFGNGSAPFWAAMKYVGARPDPDDPPVAGMSTASFNWWDWDPGSTELDEDRERYRVMANGEVDDVSLIGQSGMDDPVELLSVGPFHIFAPGDTIQVVFAFLGGRDMEHLRTSADVVQKAYESGYVIPGPPPSPRLLVRPGENLLEVCWDDSVEALPDPADSTLFDFEGYRIYVTRTAAADVEDYVLVRELDVPDSIGYNTGMDAVRLAEPIVEDGVTYDYRYVLDNLKDGFRYWVSVTSYDTGNEKIGSLESGVKQNLTLAVPGSRPAANPRQVRVFPNPYHGDAVWDGARERERYLWFANLPERALIRIYSLSGDLVNEIDFDGATYDAGNITGIRSTSGESLSFSGGMCAWDLISRNDQPVASGLYLYTVSDRANGEVFVGKFMVIR